jgi:type II secretory pathway component PulF
LGEAAARLEADHLTRRDIQNAFVYPAFLLASGAASLVFLLYTVVPRFDQMLNNAQTKVSGFSGLILGAGRLFHDHAIAISAILIAAIGGLYALLQTREGREAFQALAARTPVLGSIITIRRRAAWARTMALALGAGVSVLDATALAASALPDGAVRHGARTSIAALKSGKPIDEAYLSVGAISPIDAGLIRAGQRTGALAEMFRAVADRNDADLKVALKRFTLIVEPVAVAIVAITIGAIVLGLVSALVSIYDSIG